MSQHEPVTPVPITAADMKAIEAQDGVDLGRTIEEDALWEKFAEASYAPHRGERS